MRENPGTNGTGHRARLRCRLVEQGDDALAEHELLELLLATALPRVDTKKTAWALLHAFGSLGRVLNASPKDLTSVKGVGPAAVGALKIVKAVAGACLREPLRSVDALSSPEAVADYCRVAYGGERDEAVHLLLLDSGNRLKRAVRISQGTVDQAAVHPRRLVEETISAGANGAILVHNHPSGRCEPSGADDRITEEAAAALKAIDVKLLDHVIIGEGRIYSYRVSGRL